MLVSILCALKGSLVQRVDFPVSGENVREADKRGAGSAELAFARYERMTEGLLGNLIVS